MCCCRFAERQKNAVQPALSVARGNEGEGKARPGRAGQERNECSLGGRKAAFSLSARRQTAWVDNMCEY